MAVGLKRWRIGGNIIGIDMKNNKSLGQHWLKNRAILEKIAELTRGGDIDKMPENDVLKEQNCPERALKDSTSRLCIEIGPGLGTLTSSLLKRFQRVVAVEYDPSLAKNLPLSFPGKNLEVKNADFLEFDLESVEKPYVIAGNIPYYITSPIIDKILSAKNRPERAVLLVQKEVAERVAAPAGRHSVLSLSTQNRAEVQLGPVVPREEFTPPPKVDSQVIILTPREKALVPEAVMDLVKRGFSAPRKKLIKNLGQVSKEELLRIFKEVGISPDVRPAELTLFDWEKLQKLLVKK